MCDIACRIDPEGCSSIPNLTAISGLVLISDVVSKRLTLVHKKRKINEKFYIKKYLNIYLIEGNIESVAINLVINND
ncbi:hypothetical protein GCM10020331_100560 [Ectobacillus funiculus]